MIAEPWFPIEYAWVPGTVYGLAAAGMGAMVGWLVPQGRARQGLLRAWYILWAAAVVLLVAGAAALIAGQPWGVWFGVLLPGGIGTVVIGANTLVILKAYHVIETRRVAAKDLL